MHYYLLCFLSAGLIPASSSVDTQGKHAEWTLELGEVALEVEWVVGARYESLSYFSHFINAVMTCLPLLKFFGLQLRGSMSFYNQINCSSEVIDLFILLTPQHAFATHIYQPHPHGSLPHLSK